MKPRFSTALPAALLLCVGACPLAKAAVFNVNVTIQDAVDNNPGDGECRISSGDFCTLRAAVMEANALPGTDVIVLPGNATITLDITGTGNSAATGDLDITESVLIGTFIVPDDELPVIDASALDNRIFDVRPSTDTFTLQRVILSGGSNTSGGAIYVRDGVTGWIHNWKKRGWRTADKKPVKNVELWQRLDEAAQRHDIHWKWVKGHAGDAMNERADLLARTGMKPFQDAKRKT